MCMLTLAWGFLKTNRMIQYPFLAAGAVSAQFLPQLMAATSPESAASFPGEFALARFALMLCLCFGAGVLGYFYTGRKPKYFNWDMNLNKLLAGGIALVLGGLFFSFLLGRLPREQLEATQWSGMPVRYLFFARMGVYGFSICLLIFLKSFNKVAFLGILPGLFSFVELLIIGRRGATATIGLAVLAGIWFCMRRIPPRFVILAGMAAFVLFAFSIGEYRDIQRSDKDKKIDEIKKIRFIDKFNQEFIRENQSDELVNAVYLMEAIQRRGAYNYGATLYNTLIAAYVPRQIFGDEFKKSLMVKTPEEIAYEELNYSLKIGSCTTGVADVFVAFSYFGCIIFFLQGWLMRRMWEGASAGGMVYQIIYLAQAAFQIAAFNGAISNLTTPWVHVALFAGPVLLYARNRRRVWDPSEAR